MTSDHALADLAWPDVVSRPVVLVPVGSTEQHGPHLPLDTDTVIANSVASAVALRLGNDILVAPPVNYGSSGEHQSFAGTVSIGAEALSLVIVELVRSISLWADRVLLVNGHGGNISSLTKAVRQLRDEMHDVAWVPCAVTGSDLHAGITETSVMLHVRPESVRMERATAGAMDPINEILPTLISGGVASVSVNGVLGNPTGASAASGQHLLELMVDDCLERIAGGVVSDRGMLCKGEERVPSSVGSPC